MSRLLGYPIAPNACERAVVGAVLLNPSVLPGVMDRIEGPDAFADQPCGVVYESMIRVRKSGRTPDVTAVVNDLHTSGAMGSDVNADAILDMMNACQTSALAVEYAAVVAEAHAKRQAGKAGSELARMAARGETTVEELAEQNAAIADYLRVQAGGAAIRTPEGDAAMEHLTARMEGRHCGDIPTGLHDLDAYIDGLARTQIFVVAARTSVGKTALALNVTCNAAVSGHRVLFISCEMSEQELTERLICIHGGIDSSRLRPGVVTDLERSRLRMAAQAVTQMPIHISVPTRKRICDIESIIRRAHLAHGLDLVVVDYVGLIDPNQRCNSRAEAMSEISRALKSLAVELNVPMLVLAQLNREADGARARLSHLRDSGAIEQDADRVLLLNPDEKAKPMQPIVMLAGELAKNRHGRTGYVNIEFNKPTQRMFCNSDPVAPSPPRAYTNVNDDLSFD